MDFRPNTRLENAFRNCTLSSELMLKELGQVLSADLDAKSHRGDP